MCKIDNSYGLEKLGEVWDRVTSVDNIQEDKTFSSSSEIYDDKETLRHFIQDELNDWELYKKLAAKCSGRAVKMTFRKIANDEYLHLKKLQRFYFILTGDSYAPPQIQQEIRSMLSLLRDRYIAECNGEKAYESAASATPNKKLGQLYKELAADEARHAVEIERMIEKIIG